MNFRTDINGLRAIAVLGVVVFHFVDTALPGGFAGVDVFFVISGFLMTSIIFRGLQAQNFHLADFYLARARRIVPALTVVCSALLGMGWFYLHPLDFGTLGAHALGSLSFVSNFVYLKESGYFDEASREKWLLHTWSLSVEWQFYVVYPLALVVLRKFMRLEVVRYVLVAATFISFALYIYATGRWPSSAFYLLPTRAWEMLVGGLAFLYPIALAPSVKKWTEATGLMLIVSAYAGLSESVAWPGHWAALPVVGAVLVIVANRERSWATGSSVFQWMGSASYSIYLWHWPVVVWLNYAGKDTDLGWLAMGLLLSVGLGAVSYYGVENRKQWLAFSRYLAPLLGPNLGWLFGAVVAVALVVFYRDGFVSRLSPQYADITQYQVMPRRDNGYCFYDFNGDTPLAASSAGSKCVLGDRSKAPTALLFGDSFAGHFEPFWDELGRANGLAIDTVTTNWCVPIAGSQFDGPESHPAYQQCRINRQTLAQDMGKYDLIIFGGQWSNSLRSGHLQEVMASMRQAASTVSTVIVMPPPVRYDTNVLKRFQRNLFYQAPFDLSRYSTQSDAQEQEAYAKLRQSANDLSNVIFLERGQLFSSSGTYAKAGYDKPYSLDGMHITVEGSLVVAKDFQKTDAYRQTVQPLLVLAKASAQR